MAFNVYDLGLTNLYLRFDEEVFHNQFAISMENSRGFEFWILDKSGMSVDTTGSIIKLSQRKNGIVYQTACNAKDESKGHYIVMFAPEALMTTGELEIQWIISKGNETLRSIPKNIKVYEALDFSSPSGGNLILDWHTIEETAAKIESVQQEVEKIEQIKTELSDVLTTENERREYHKQIKPVIDGWINNPEQFKGEQGLQGPQGPPGPKGDVGPQGLTGASNNLVIGSVSSSQDAAATIEGASPNQILNLVLPKGPKGDQGIQGIQGIPGPQGPPGPVGKGLTILGEKDNDGELPPSGNLGDGWLIQGDLYVWQGTGWLNVGNIKGPKGDKGDNGQQGPPGPQGVKGNDGIPGPQGPAGNDGQQGPPGPAGAPGTTDYNQLQNLPDLSIYQPKEAGKGLSTNDYTAQHNRFVTHMLSKSDNNPLIKIDFTNYNDDQSKVADITFKTTKIDAFSYTISNNYYLRLDVWFAKMVEYKKDGTSEKNFTATHESKLNATPKFWVGTESEYNNLPASQKNDPMWWHAIKE